MKFILESNYYDIIIMNLHCANSFLTYIFRPQSQRIFREGGEQSNNVIVNLKDVIVK